MKTASQYFAIDLDSKCPEVLDFSGENLDFDLKFFNAKSALDLSNYDRRVFKDEDDAETWLETYKATLKGLRNADICLDRSLPAMLYKRRYIVQTLLGEKCQTYRHYRKNWMPGQLFNLHDQTFFLTVRLTKLSETPLGYKYEFELP